MTVVFSAQVLWYCSVMNGVWTLQSDEEAGNAKASEDTVKGEEGVKGEGDIKDGETEPDSGAAKLDSEPKLNGSTEADKPDQNVKEEAKDKQKGEEEVKKGEGKKEETKKEPKEQLPEKPILQLHGKHSSSGKLIAFIVIAFHFFFVRYMLHFA